MKYYVYIIKTVDNTLYCGITNDIKKRYSAHKNKKGAKYTISHPPEKIVYLEIFEDKSAASKEEYRIKKTLNRSQKLDLIKEKEKNTEKLLKNEDIIDF